jgi:hypothetical protein
MTRTRNTPPAFQLFARDWMSDPNVMVMPLAAPVHRFHQHPMVFT